MTDIIDTRNSSQTPEEALTESEALIEDIWEFLKSQDMVDDYLEWSQLNE